MHLRSSRAPLKFFAVLVPKAGPLQLSRVGMSFRPSMNESPTRKIENLQNSVDCIPVEGIMGQSEVGLILSGAPAERALAKSNHSTDLHIVLL